MSRLLYLISNWSIRENVDCGLKSRLCDIEKRSKVIACSTNAFWDALENESSHAKMEHLWVILTAPKFKIQLLSESYINRVPVFLSTINLPS